jgi:hypothetical protein
MKLRLLVGSIALGLVLAGSIGCHENEGGKDARMDSRVDSRVFEGGLSDGGDDAQGSDASLTD